MAGDSEQTATSAVATMSHVADGITTKDKAMFGYGLLVGMFDEANGLLKLQLGLETGAVVLFVKILADAHFPNPVLVALAISTFFFGISAYMCLELLGKMVQVRVSMLKAWSDDGANWSKVLDVEMKAWESQVAKISKRMNWSFGLALLFAIFFVVGVLLTR